MLSMYYRPWLADQSSGGFAYVMSDNSPKPFEGGRQPLSHQHQQLEALFGLLSVGYTGHEYLGELVLAGHGSVYGSDALPTITCSPAHRGVVQRRTSPGRSEDIAARGSAEARVGRHKLQGVMLLGVYTTRGRGVDELQDNRWPQERETGRNGLDSLGRYVCLCGRFRCFFFGS